MVPLKSLSQTPSRSEAQDDERLVVGTSEVVLDAIVKDKKGHPVKNLKAEDFEVYEDGVRQQIASFRLVLRQPNQPAEQKDGVTQPAAKNSAQPNPVLSRDPANSIGAVALVFDRLTPDSRARARAAALSYVDEGLGPGDFAGVFAVNQTLQVLQPYTNNTQLVKHAIEDAGSRSSSAYSSTAGQVRDMGVRQQGLENATAALESTLAGGASGPSGAASQTATANEMGAAAAEQQLNDMAMRSLETFERIERDQQGYATTNALLALINSMRSLPGRKAILFFSEGIAIPPAVQQQFNSVISNANRANVSIYAVDAAGLRAISANEETRREIVARGTRRLNQVSSGRDETGGPMMRGLERNEDLLSLNPDSGLGRLADQTGGKLISETNNIAPRLREIGDDLHSYYVLTYVPKNQNLDGRFRTVNVKLNHADLLVQTRKGYYAINTTDGSPMLGYEAPALAALSNGSRADTFPLRAAGFNFPGANRSDLTSFLVEVPAGVVNYSVDNENKLFRSDFSIVVLIKDTSQRVVRKFSNQYLLNGPLTQLEAAKRGEILFYREAELPPGRYTIAVAAYDALTGQASVRSQAVEVQDGDASKVRLSSLAILKRVEQIKPQDQKPNSPFLYGEVLVYPNVGEPLSKSADKQLAFFFTAYPAQGAKQPALKSTVEILQQRRSLGQATVELPAPDPTGRVQFASALPIGQLQPGEYELRVTVSDGTVRASRTEPFTVRP
jgi:VWFA-related protein